MKQLFLKSGIIGFNHSMPAFINKIIFISILALLFTNCSKEHEEAVSPIDTKGYPIEISQIMLTSCAISGCHNDISKAGAGGLSLVSWNNLFEGSRGGSPVIPYRSDQSFLMYFINTDPNQGVTLSPTMPFNADPLSQGKYEVIRDWINSGAPDINGHVKFSDNADRSKYYITNQGCDMVSVFDSDTKVLMRYIDVGSSAAIESPHQVKVSPDGKFWYVIFFSGSTIQKFNAIDDSYVGEINIGAGSWNTFRISSDSKFAYIIDWQATGGVAIVDLESMEMLKKFNESGMFEFPHGSYLNKAGDILYVTAQHGNFIYKVNITDLDNPVVNKVSLNGFSPTSISFLDPHEIEMSPDESKYFVTCQKTNEVRILNTSNDSLIAVIPTGDFPQEFAVSESMPYLFVACTEDVSTFPGNRGSVHVINYSTNALVKKIYTGHQPHGIAIDDSRQTVYVAHRNADPDGPAPHHSTDCAGRNGYITTIDINTLELHPGYKVEVSVDPYGIGVRN